MNLLTHNGTNGRTYGGDPNLIHIPDQHRADVGRIVADALEDTMRLMATLGVGHNPVPLNSNLPLCPGCYMIALFDAAVELARRTNQPVEEIGASMCQLFQGLARDGEYRPTEEMIVTSTIITLVEGIGYVEVK